MQVAYELLDGHKVIAFNSHYLAERYAKKHDLKLAEYGDVYGKDIAYAYWNKSGNRYDTEDIIAYYCFNEKGHACALDKDAFLDYIYH